MCVSSFSTAFVWNIFHSKKNWARYDQKCILVFMESTLYSCPSVMKLDFCQQIFEKYSYIKFRESLSIGSRVVPCGQTEGWTESHDEANSRISQFCEGAYKYNSGITRSVILYCPEFGGLKSLTNITFNIFDDDFCFSGPHIHVAHKISNLHFSIRVKDQIARWRNFRGKINIKNCELNSNKYFVNVIVIISTGMQFLFDRHCTGILVYFAPTFW